MEEKILTQILKLIQMIVGLCIGIFGLVIMLTDDLQTGLLFLILGDGLRR